MRGKFLVLLLIFFIIHFVSVNAVCDPPCDSDEICEYDVVCSVNPDCTCGPNHGGDNCGMGYSCDNGCTCEPDACAGTWSDCGSPGQCAECANDKQCVNNVCTYNTDCNSCNLCVQGECCGGVEYPAGTCCTLNTCSSSYQCGYILDGCAGAQIACGDYNGDCEFGYDCSGHTCVCDPVEQKDIFCGTSGMCGETTVCAGTPQSTLIKCLNGTGPGGCTENEDCIDEICVASDPCIAAYAEGNCGYNFSGHNCLVCPNDADENPQICTALQGQQGTCEPECPTNDDHYLCTSANPLAPAELLSTLFCSPLTEKCFSCPDPFDWGGIRRGR